MDKDIKVIIKRPDSVPFEKSISNTLETFQKEVGGYIETVSGVISGKNVIAIVNEEGLLIGMPYCCHWYGSNLVGNVIWCGVDGEEFADVPITLESFKKRYPEMWGES